MKKKNIIFALLLVCTVSYAYSQKKRSFFVDTNGDYVILLDSDVKKSKKPLQNIQGAEMDIFIKTTNKNFNYTLIISKISEHNFLDGNILDDSFEEYYKNTCNCSVIEKELVLYNNLETLRYKIKTSSDEKEFIAYSDNFLSNGLLYNVLFLVLEKNFDIEKVNHDNNMNSLIINGKTTVDGYK